MDKDLDQEMLRAVELDDARDDRLQSGLLGEAYAEIEALNSRIDLLSDSLYLFMDSRRLVHDCLNDKVDRLAQEVSFLRSFYDKGVDSLLDITEHLWSCQRAILDSLYEHVGDPRLAERIDLLSDSFALLRLDGQSGEVREAWIEVAKKRGLIAPDAPPADDD